MTNENGTTRVAAFLLAATMLTAVTLSDAVAGIKCWTNSEGVRECGNSVPPEYAQKGHREVSKTGVTVGGTDRARTAEELEADRAAAAQVQREKAEAERAAREADSRDRVLLHTFTTEQDLLLARDDKLGAIDNRINHTDEVIARLRETLEQMYGDAAKLERGGKPVPDDLKDSITRVERQIGENLALIERRHTEKTELAARFDADLARYRELKSAQ